MPDRDQSKRDDEEVRVFVENFAGLLSELGMPRMAARVLIAVTAAEAEALTAAELADQLGVSPAAISNALKYLTHLNMVVREPVPNSRRDRYRMLDQDWFLSLYIKSGAVQRVADLAGTGIEPLGGMATRAGARMTRMRYLYQFVADEMPLMMDKWLAKRAAEAADAG